MRATSPALGLPKNDRPYAREERSLELGGGLGGPPEQLHLKARRAELEIGDDRGDRGIGSRLLGERPEHLGQLLAAAGMISSRIGSRKSTRSIRNFNPRQAASSRRNSGWRITRSSWADRYRSISAIRPSAARRSMDP